MSNVRLAYRIDELAAALGRSRRTIERMIAEGDLPTTKKFGGVLIPAAAVNALLAGEEARPRRPVRRL